MIAYHGYWPNDLYSVNSHFGTSDDLQALSAALHARGMVSRRLPYLLTKTDMKK
jgi:maltooligosyltrehalose synthase